MRQMNKKAQFESKLLAVILIFIIGIIIMFSSMVNVKFYEHMDKYFESSDRFNESDAHIANQKILAVEESIWDYAFFAIFIGLILQILLFSFATRVNLAFYWLMVIVDIPILVVGVMLSNIWQSIAASGSMTETIARFPLTNLILGSYYPVVVLFIIFVSSIILFGKRPSGGMQ